MTQVAENIQKFKSWLKNAGLSQQKHQIDGMEWCLKREYQKINGIKGGIIADEMGLGKTILMLGIIISNFKKNGTIIIVPPALLDQWTTEIKRLFGHQPIIYHGKQLKKTRIKLVDNKHIPILITTYGIIVNRKKNDPLFNRKWSRMICDEAHHMRNKKSILFKKINMVKASIKWMVTGTPIQNKAKDLFALCMVLGSHKAIKNNPKNAEQIIIDHSLRRTKKQIGLNLPPIQYHIINVKWSSDEEKNFAADIHSNLAFPNVTRKNINRIVAFLGGQGPLPWLTRARQACIFPQLLNKNIQKLIDEGVLDENANTNDIMTTSKITAVVKKLFKRKYNNRRKLVFCHYHGEIDILSALLNKFGITYNIIDGRQHNKHKKFATQKVLSQDKFLSVCKKWRDNKHAYKLIADFMAPDVCLCQIQTASEGLNLQHFQEIYFTSPWWNPALEDQAIARAHRIGQTQKVDVFRFAMQNFGEETKTLDQYCLEVQLKKRAIVQKFGF